MKKYLAELHTKPDHHKKRFAFIVSGIVTLFIFSFWTMATFGPEGRIANNKVEETKESNPFEALKSNVSSSFSNILTNFELLISNEETYGR